MRADSNATPFFYFYCDLVSTHTNSWAMVKIFEVLCSFLSIRPSVPIFKFFFEMRLIGKTAQVSLNVVSKRLFEYNVNIFKQYEDHFFKIMPVSAYGKELGLLFKPDKEPCFPLYW